MRRSFKILIAAFIAAGISFLPGISPVSEIHAAATPSNAGIQERARSMTISTDRKSIEVDESMNVKFQIFDTNISDSDIFSIDWSIDDPDIAEFQPVPQSGDRTATVVGLKDGYTDAVADVTYNFCGDTRAKTLKCSIYVGGITSAFDLVRTPAKINLNETGTYTLKINDPDQVNSIDEIAWEITDTSIADFAKTPGLADQTVTVKGLKTGESHIYARVVFNGGKKESYGNGIFVVEGSGSGSSSGGSSGGGSGSSGGGSGSSGGSSGGGSGSSGGSSSRNSKAAKAEAPLPAVTPLTTDGNGTVHFGDAVIAQPPMNYSEYDRTLLITSGTWTMNSSGYWQLNGTNAGDLRGRWALVSDSLSRNPAGNASWFYFDSNGYAASGWRWIAGMDGVYRCYYFNREEGSLFGACLLNGTTPDGYTVDSNGAWTVDGVVQTK